MELIIEIVRTMRHKDLFPVLNLTFHHYVSQVKNKQDRIVGTKIFRDEYFWGLNLSEAINLGIRLCLTEDLLSYVCRVLELILWQ